MRQDDENRRREEEFLDYCKRENLQTRIEGRPADLCQVRAVMSVNERGCYMADFYTDSDTGREILNFDFVPDNR